jgi:plastocyanin
MKKLYSLLFVSTFTFLSFIANAGTVNIAVGTNGSTAANAYFPSAATANVGDVIQFTLANSVHTVTSTSVPSGATAFDSGNMTTVGQQFTYTVTVAGTYTYQCNIHGSSMSGTITVSSVGITDPTINPLTSVYPSPFKENVTVKYNGIESIEFINIVGEKVKTVEMPATEGKIEVSFDNFPTGIYFYRTYKDGVIYETRKIVKTK